MVLAAGHMCVDFCQGAVPALLPFMIRDRGYSYAAVAALVLASSIGSSLIQPLFGLRSDRTSAPWLMPVGVLVGGIGIGLAGIAPSYALTFAAVLVSGVGVAAFHPEGARYANHVSGARRATGMSYFSLGGNAGFALGPALVTPLVLLFGLPGTVFAALLPAAVAAWLLRELPRIRGFRPRLEPSSHGDRSASANHWAPFSRLAGVASLRSIVYFGLQAFVPAWFVTRFAASEAEGNAALTAMLVAGALGTLVCGRLADRIGRRAVLAGSMGALVPLLALFVLADQGPATALLVPIGLFTIANFSVTIVMGQEYLPGRLGLASGITVGLAIGVGGLAAAGLGVVADSVGLEAVMWTLAALPPVAFLLALTLPRTARVAEPEVMPRRP